MPDVRRRINLTAFCSDFAAFLFMGAFFLRLADVTGTRAGGAESDLNGTIQAIAAGGYALLAMRMGVWSDRLSRTISCRLGTIGAGIFGLWAASASTALGLGACAVGYWGARSLFWPALQAGLGDLANDGNRSRWIASFNLSWCLGKAAGFLCAGVIVTLLGTSPALAASGVLAIFAALLVPPLPGGLSGPEPAAAAPRAGRFLLAAWVANFTAFGVGNVLVSQVPVLGRSLSETPAEIDGQLFFLYACQTVSFFLLSRWQGWLDRRWPFAVLGVCIVFPALLLPLVPSALARVPLLALVGAGFGFAYQASLTYSLATGGARGARAGIHEFALGMGACVVPLMAGRAALYWGGPAGAFYLAAAVAGGLVLFQGLLLRESR